MSTTDTDVIVTQYRAEFRGEHFSGCSWHLGGWESREELPRRRAWTVARDMRLHPNARDITAEILRRNWRTGILSGAQFNTSAARVILVTDEPGSRYGIALVIEERQRNALTSVPTT